MIKNTKPNSIKELIKSRSKKDCIPDAPKLCLSSAFIPFPLKDLLDNDRKLDPKMSPISKQYYEILRGLSSFDDWSPDIYWFLWKLLLYLEFYQAQVDMSQYLLKDQTLTESKCRPGEFVVAVPNLSEDRPSIKENDIIDLLQTNGNNKCEGTVTWVGLDYVAVDVSAEFRNKFNHQQKYNIEFRIDQFTARCQNFTLDRMYKYDMSSMFFPQKNIAHNPKFTYIEWINKNIETNSEQMQAVTNILKKTSHPAPYILFGPPGTGKTSTLVEAICQIIIKNPSVNILICTPSNSAADEIVERLMKNPRVSLNNENIYRMYSLSRKASDVNPLLKSVSNFADLKTISLSRNVFITKKIVVTTLATATRLHSYNLRSDHFSYLFIDEAGQATELETLNPIVLMSGINSKNVWHMSGQVVIAGDPKQLGPHCQSKLAEPLLGISMLERLMKWGPYVRNGENKFDPLYVTKLVQNYRCHNTILHIPNMLFYDGELIAKGGKHTTRALNWEALPNKSFPLIFHAARGEESRKKYSPSICNQLEVTKIMDYVKKLLKSNIGNRKVCPNDIGIITPYRLQRRMIHEALQAKKEYNEIPVGTIEAFQGQEKDIIIISTVRTCVYQHKDRVHVGFLSNPKRFNVALTRAKALLIVIGHPDILQQDRCWREFMKYCYQNGACKGEKFVLNRSLHNLDIRNFTDKLKNIMYEPPNNNKRVVEDPTSSSKYQEDQKCSNRRRRLPTGRMSKMTEIDSENVMKLLLKDLSDNDLHKEEYLNWRNQSDGSDDDCSTNEDELTDNDNDDELHNTSLEDDLSLNFFKNLMIDEKKFELDLHTRMAKLKMRE